MCNHESDMTSAYGVAQYITDLRAIRSTGSATAETSFYPPLDRLLNTAGQKLKPAVLFSTQLRNQGAGMPDGGFFPQTASRRRNAEPPILQNPERGVVEIKPADHNLDTLTNEPQTLRYLKQYGLALITNLREFRLLQLTSAGTTQTLERYTLAATLAALWDDPLTRFARHADLLPDFLARVMLYRAPLVQPKDVAWLLASYAREARARAEDHPLGSFGTVKLALQESLGIQFEGEKGEHFFRSTLVQTLFYGIFSAWILWRRVPENRVPGARFDWRVSAHYLRVPVLRKLFGEVSDPGALNSVQLQEILNLAGEALNRVQPAFFEIFREEEAVAYFYEPFLEAFDPELRKDLGVWYTPKEIVRYMVERVDHLLRTELNQPLGLASPAVRILDPCCGTGAYLTAVLHRIHQTLLENAGDDTALVPNDLRTIALTRVFGFEIMPAPFVIAHLQLASLLENAGAPLTDDHRAGVYLTNALTGWVPEEHPQSVIFEEFRREREDSEQIKQQGPILVILGNPPYNGYAGIAKIEEERDLTNEYRTPVEGLPAPQGQGLNDLYIRFFRIAERRIAANADGKGIISFISNYSWLDGLSHPSMRHKYLNTFADIYIDNLHGDRKISEYAPDGRTSETVFAVTGTSVGIRIGTAISTLVRNTRSRQKPALLHYRDFDEARASERREALTQSIATHEPRYSPLKLSSTLGLPFKPRVVGTDYLTWPRVPELFPESFPGVQSGRDDLVTDISSENLEKRIRNYLNAKFSHAEMDALVPGTMIDSKTFRATEVRVALQTRGFRPWQILPFAYRPYDKRWLYWEPTTNLLDRKREEYLRQYLAEVPVIFLAQKNRMAFDPPGITCLLANRHLNERGANVFPLSTMGEPLPGHVESRMNLSEVAARYLNEMKSEYPSLFFHSLAIMHTPQYRTENSGALMSDWPRIPLPATADLLAHSATLGRRLAELLDAESSIGLTAEWSFLAALKLPKNSDLENALKLTAGWGYRGQGSTVMPGQGLSPERQWSAVEREKLAALATAQSLTLEDALALLGEFCVDVHLNGESFWPAIPINVWNYTLGGYQVLKKWLSYREFPLLGRPLHSEEAAYVAQVVRRIAAILLLGPALDASYLAILPTATGLPTV
jgi:hypothetical protein